MFNYNVITETDLQRKIDLQILRLDSLISLMKSDREERKRKRQARKREIASMLSKLKQ